ncbi:hypothetical protein TWF506_007935 [Arthrobotrys conoides]|uniref:C2H2-type domain-containing protein n=1 Tax=Arthrobotrys conoides TaxID=74498 RepID=A0AAN8S008_9PEZI
METHLRRGDHSRQNDEGLNLNPNSADENGKMELATDEEIYYTCRRCGKEFLVLSGLVQHIESQACKEGRRWAVDHRGIKWEAMVKAIGII